MREEVEAWDGGRGAGSEGGGGGEPEEGGEVVRLGRSRGEVEGMTRRFIGGSLDECERYSKQPSLLEAVKAWSLEGGG